jgi:hypothetical protein
MSVDCWKVGSHTGSCTEQGYIRKNGTGGTGARGDKARATRKHRKIYSPTRRQGDPNGRGKDTVTVTDT